MAVPCPYWCLIASSKAVRALSSEALTWRSSMAKLTALGRAIAATVGIFLPAFALVWVVNPWVPKLRQSRWASGFLDGVNAASLGLMAGVTYTLAQTALVDGVTIMVVILSAIAVFRFNVNSAWLVLAGGAIGLGSHLMVSGW